MGTKPLQQTQDLKVLNEKVLGFVYLWEKGESAKSRRSVVG